MTEFEKMTDKPIAMTEGELATLGGGVVAYIQLIFIFYISSGRSIASFRTM